jgi:Lipase (class 3)
MWGQYAKTASRCIPALLAGGSIISPSCYRKASAEQQQRDDVEGSSSATRDNPEATAAKVCRINDFFAKEGTGIFHQISKSLKGVNKRPADNSSNKDDASSVDLVPVVDSPGDASIRDSANNTDLLSMLYKAIQAPSQQQQQQSVGDVVKAIVDRSQQEGVVEDRKKETCVFNFMRLLDQYQNDLKRIVDTYGHHLDMNRLSTLALLYYLEHEDEVKNPSWKRRVHRFFPGIGSTQMDQLNSALRLSTLSYADTVQEIEDGLAELDPNYRLVACTVDSEPGKPAYFLAIHKHRQQGTFLLSGRLRAILVIRGSKSVADTLTDVICEPVPYRGGKAHRLILESGRYIARKNRELLTELSNSTGLSVSELDLTIIGHSLGAGAATIAAMELKEDGPALLDLNVIGFGGPAILSQDLAVATASYVTSVINNDDVVPRMSGASVANVIAQLLEFNWMDHAEYDITQACDVITKGLPLPLTAKQLLLDNVRTLVTSVAPDFSTDRKKPEPLPIELFPAGKCIHLYRDGVGISGCVVPNTFFNQIDVSRTMVSGTSL